MNIRHRVSDISDLQTQILQAYFRMGVDCLYPNGTWKTVLVEYIKNKGLQKDAQYAGAWGKIQYKGIENYNIEDMDTTIIIALNRHSKNSPFVIVFNAEPILINLNSDRKANKHTAGNESLGELLGWAFCSLTNMERLLEEISKATRVGDKRIKDAELNENVKRAMIEKYRSLIIDQRHGLENDFREAIAEDAMILYEIELLKKSRRLWDDWETIYWKKYALRARSIDDNILVYRFLVAAADAEIKYAYKPLADIYFDELGMNDRLGIRTDYQLAAKFYRKDVACSDVQPAFSESALNLASIYINGLDQNHTKDEGKALLETIRKPQPEKVIEYITEEGYTFYSFTHKYVFLKKQVTKHTPE